MVEQNENRPIVVGVDDSDAARKALAWAIEEASLRRCSVHAVTVWSVDPATDFVWTPSEQIRKIAEEKLSSTVRLAVQGREHVPPIVERAVEGPPAKALVEAAQEAAMLVVATHRGERLRKALLGSVSASCVRHSNVPVVVVRPEPEGA
ncbi:nucleotide-binding universal stress UspA family protein [Kibdelosporangium banguiense]|uniref:Nucleotide-binding universal stress UspA family protein n=1 Tax=Kibdelosporangium banguiense TaxID=1365924 RepID=A0ABS4TWI1_9PSEU|nr:universal stress protein [Kibdelosporangium banguiense]MBP2328771.1 nucleotide-binding universal stress UspA family protein [Kibdelosporangium banguiense]